MSNREKQEELEKLREQGIPVYSFSMLDTTQNCPYEAYLTYVKNRRSEQLENIYGRIGGITHNCLEDIMNGRATEADLYPTIHKGLEELEMCGITFPQGSNDPNSIRDGWIANMDHFAKTYKAPKGKFETEQFFLYKTPKGKYLQGYIDLLKIRSDGAVEIYDYKTSTAYSGQDKHKHAKQLLLYALGKEQEGFPVKTIAWIFLKYCEAHYIGRKTKVSKKDSECIKVVERRKLVKELDFAIRAKLEESGVDDMTIDLLMEEALEKNEIPEQVRDQFVMKPHVLKYELSDETKKDAEEYFDRVIEDWENKLKIMSDANEKELFPPLAFTKKKKNGEEVPDDFYHRQLCGYRNICPYLKEYLASKEIVQTEDTDLF